MHKLSNDTVRLISSTQAVTGVASIVKELLENSLDVDASVIEINIENFGIDKIIVKDNGCGVDSESIPFMAKKHYTSKISSYADLSELASLGFRGEALGAIAAISELSVTTRCQNDRVGRSYKLSCEGDIIAESRVPCTFGTTITLSNLYKKIPVRRQFYSNTKRKKDELKKLMDIVMAYSIIHYRISITVKHDKAVIWQKPSLPNLDASVSHILTPQIKQLLSLHQKEITHKVQLEMYLPNPLKLDNDILYRTSTDRIYMFVNRRYVRPKALEKALRQYVCPDRPNRWPVGFIHLILSPADVDVNSQPDKSEVMFAEEDSLLEEIRSFLHDIYTKSDDLIPQNDNQGETFSHHQFKEDGINNLHDTSEPCVRNSGYSLSKNQSDNIFEQTTNFQTNLLAQSISDSSEQVLGGPSASSDVRPCRTLEQEGTDAIVLPERIDSPNLVVGDMTDSSGVIASCSPPVIDSVMLTTQMTTPHSLTSQPETTPRLDDKPSLESLFPSVSTRKPSHLTEDYNINKNLGLDVFTLSSDEEDDWMSVAAKCDQQENISTNVMSPEKQPPLIQLSPRVAGDISFQPLASRSPEDPTNVQVIVLTPSPSKCDKMVESRPTIRDGDSNVPTVLDSQENTVSPDAVLHSSPDSNDKDQPHHDESIVEIGSSVCNLYNDESTAAASTPVRQSQLTQFYPQTQESAKPIPVDKWAKGQANLPQPVEMLRPRVGEALRTPSMISDTPGSCVMANKKIKITGRQENQPSIATAFKAVKPIEPSKNRSLRDVDVTFNVDRLIQSYQRIGTSPQSASKAEVVGYIAGGCMVLSYGSLYALSVHRAQEFLFKQEMLEKPLPGRTLTPSIEVDLSSDEGVMLNKKLLYSGGLPLDHPNLLLHGYTLSLSSGKLQIMKVPIYHTIPSDLSDLCEIVRMMEDASSSYRSSAAEHYIEMEINKRMALRPTPAHRSGMLIESLLSHHSAVDLLELNCLHGHPLGLQLHRLPTV